MFTSNYVCITREYVLVGAVCLLAVPLSIKSRNHLYVDDMKKQDGLGFVQSNAEVVK